MRTCTDARLLTPSTQPSLPLFSSWHACIVPLFRVSLDHTSCLTRRPPDIVSQLAGWLACRDSNTLLFCPDVPRTQTLVSECPDFKHLFCTSITTRAVSAASCHVSLIVVIGQFDGSLLGNMRPRAPPARTRIRIRAHIPLSPINSIPVCIFERLHKKCTHPYMVDVTHMVDVNHLC